MDTKCKREWVKAHSLFCIRDSKTAFWLGKKSALLVEQSFDKLEAVVLRDLNPLCVGISV
jgi:hypothetical protein